MFSVCLSNSINRYHIQGTELNGIFQLLELSEYGSELAKWRTEG